MGEVRANDIAGSSLVTKSLRHDEINSDLNRIILRHSAYHIFKDDNNSICFFVRAIDAVGDQTE